LWSRNDESTAADVPRVVAATDSLEVSKTDQGVFLLVWIDCL